MSFLGKLGFTSREKTVISVLALALLAGSVISIYRNYQISKTYETLSPEDSVKVDKLKKISGGLTKGQQEIVKSNGTAINEVITYPIDINTASVEQLIILPGIGSVLAERIVAYRTENGAFTSVDSLINVPGIGIKKLDSIKDKITLLKPRMEK